MVLEWLLWEGGDVPRFGGGAREVRGIKSSRVRGEGKAIGSRE